MKQKIRIPLLKDHHNHLSFYAFLHDCLNLRETGDKNEAVAKIRSLEQENLSVVLGWNSGYYDFSSGDLEKLPPVIIVNVSLHSFIMNRSAEKILNVKYPDIVANYKSAAWYEDHMARMLIFLTNLVEPAEEKFKRFFDYLYQKGIYYAEEMMLPNERAYRILQSSPFAGRTSFWADPATFKTLSPETREHINGIKFYTDGAIGTRTAAMKHPYTDDGTKGHLVFSGPSLYRALAEAASFKKAAAVHAIGDMAIAQVVNTVRKLKNNGVEFPGIRMEHCQFIDEKTAREAKELGIVFSMQPNFSTDSTVYSDRLLPRYLEHNNPFRMLIDRVGFVPGEDLLFGSDGMPHGAEPALKAALSPPFPGQKLTLDEFIAAYCMPDKTYGSIEIDSPAD